MQKKRLPVTAPDIRIVQIDVLRGIAVLGIYWINVVIFAFPHGAYAWPDLLGQADKANVAHWLFSELFVEGSMRGLFSMLFGASALIFLSEAKLDNPNGLEVVDRFFRRNLLLIGFGLIHAYILLAQWDLLYAYGLFGMFLFPLRKLRAKTLLIAGIALLAMGDAYTYVNGIVSSQQTEAAVQQPLERQFAQAQVAPTDSINDAINDALGEAGNEVGNEQTVELTSDAARESTIAAMEQDVEIYLSDYLTIFFYQVPLVAEQQSTEMYYDHVFDIGGMMLVGMALMKFGILNGGVSLRTLLLLAMSGYLIGGTLRGAESFQSWFHGFEADARDPWLLMPYNMGRLAMTLGHVGALGFLMKTGWMNPVSGYLASVGRLALTNYVGQTVISCLFFFGFGLGFYAHLERYQLVYVCLAVWAFQIVASNIYLKYYRIGPLEWVWRSLIYGKIQPLSRETG